MQSNTPAQAGTSSTRSGEKNITQILATPYYHDVNINTGNLGFQYLII